MNPARWLACGALVLLLACSAGDPPPASLDTQHDVCRFCRMPVSDGRLAAQLASPAEEPEFFDDIGCLRDSLERDGPPSAGAIARVADHRTGAWVRASAAVFSRCPALETPMGSHLVAHADAASRDADPAARACVRVPTEEVFGPGGPPDSSKAK